MKPKHLLVAALLLLLAVVLVACSPAPAPVEATPCPTAAPCPSCPTCPEPPPPPTPVVKEVPFQDDWANSPHNAAEDEPFNHWNEADPPEVPTACARCHTTQGYQDFLGADGSAVGVVDQTVPAPAGTIQCVACHNSATAKLSSVAFSYMVVPEGGGDPVPVVVSGLGREARCMVCHQGRASKYQVDQALAKFGADKDPDAVPAAQGDQSLGFVNIHYFAAAATLYGTQVKGGYEYDGKTYDGKNDHVAGYNTCIGCHNPHTLQRKINECAVCHQGVTSDEDLRNIRMNGSLVDYDGDGNITEGIAFEVDGMREILFQAIQAYAKEVVGQDIAYNVDTYPYFFIDTNGDGQLSDDELQASNGYKNWTGRLLKAAYNYQVSTKDPGAFAHGGKYIIELLYDSTDDLNQTLSTPVDLSKAHRIDAGHFAGSEEAFRHWDAEDHTVPGTCVRCHTGTGLPMFLKEGVTISQPSSNGLNCATCHNDLTTFTRYTSDQVKFPSGATLTFGEGADANLCINCHQGRESKVSLDAAIGNLGPDETSDTLNFRNPHYFAAGATLFGAEAQGAYMYDGKEYNGRFAHVPNMDNCVACHDVHSLEVKFELCQGCHPGIEKPQDIRGPNSTDDYDGDGNTTEGLAGELETVAEKVYAAIQAYATDKGLPGIVYSGTSYPYFFVDTNGDGAASADETVSSNAFRSWTPRLLRAAYNYQWYQKDPGAFAHNGKFMLQILYDALQDLGGNVSGMVRP
jgi:hypothetical protein